MWASATLWTLIEIGIGLIEIVMLIILIHYLSKINQNKHCYPIYQLSPITTILQGISFYIFQLTIVINLLYIKTYGEITWKICISQYEDKNEDVINFTIYKEVPYYVLTILYLYSRGCCFTFTLMKSLRVLTAFSKQRLLKNNQIVKFYMSETYLIIIALFYGMFFPLLTIITNLFYYKLEFYCCLSVYENNTGFVFYNSLLEEAFTLYLMLKVNYNYYDDNLINLTIKLQISYIVWFACNSLIFKLLELGPYIVGISCLVRCFYMFYNFTCIPLNGKEEHPNLYITQDQIVDFHLISSKVFNNYYKNNYSLIAFENFLSRSNRIAITQTEIEFIAQRQNFSETELFNKYLAVAQLSSFCYDSHKLTDEVIKLLNLLPTQINPYSTIDILQNDLYNHFESIYRIFFQQTVAFQAIKELTNHNKIIQDNFKILRMPLNEWNYFDKFNKN